MALKLPVGNLSSDYRNAADEAVTESTVDAEEKWDPSHSNRFIALDLAPPDELNKEICHLNDLITAVTLLTADWLSMGQSRSLSAVGAL